MRAGRMALWGGVVALGVLGATGVAAFAIGTRIGEELLLTVLIVGGHLVLAVPGAAMILRRRRAIAGWIAAGLLAASAAGWVALVWDWVSWSSSDRLMRFSWAALFSALYASQVGTLWAMRLSGLLAKGVRLAACGLGGVSLVIALGWVAELGWWPRDDVLARALGSSLAGAIGATLATPLLWRLGARRGEDAGERTLGRRVPVEVGCPRCGARVPLAANAPGRCSGCGLGITVGLEEPRCECGYLLYGLASGVCPECGREVPARLRWGDGAADGASAEGAAES